MKCLKIDDKWLRLILEGKKTWEIRRTPTNFRGRIALGNTKTKNYEGHATVIDCKQFTIRDLKEFEDKHRANDFIDEYAAGRKTLYAWTLSDASAEPKPKAYSFSTGSWCTTTPLKGSKKWIRKLVNERQAVLNDALIDASNLPKGETITWLSPLKSRKYREYYDHSFLRQIHRLDLAPKLAEFWPRGGPRWDGLGTSSSGLVFLVEAKSHISELASNSRAKDPRSIKKIQKSLDEAKEALGCKSDADWSKRYYQFANRLAYANFLRRNGAKAIFVSVYFAGDREMDGPRTADEWKKAIRLINEYLGVNETLLKDRVLELFVDAGNNDLSISR